MCTEKIRTLSKSMFEKIAFPPKCTFIPFVARPTDKHPKYSKNIRSLIRRIFTQKIRLLSRNRRFYMFRFMSCVMCTPSDRLTGKNFIEYLLL